MATTQTLKKVGFSVYLILAVLLTLFVFKANDETQPIKELFQFEYLLPALMYSLSTVLLCYLIFRLFSIYVHRYVSFTLSILIGVPLGLFFIQQFFIMITRMSI